MPKGERKKYTKEFKLSAVYLMLSKTMQPKDIFQMLDVDRQTVYRWVSEFKAHGETAFDKKAVLPGAKAAGMATLYMHTDLTPRDQAEADEKRPSASPMAGNMSLRGMIGRRCAKGF